MYRNVTQPQAGLDLGLSVPFDAGLRRHMLGMFIAMGAGLVVTGITAFAVANTPALASTIFGTPLKWLAIFAPLAFVLLLSFRVERMNMCVWNKSNAGMGSLYRSKHETVSVYRVGDAAHLNMVELGRHGRNRTNVWDYPSVNTFRGNKRGDLKLHPLLHLRRCGRMSACSVPA